MIVQRRREQKTVTCLCVRGHTPGLMGVMAAVRLTSGRGLAAISF